MVSCAMSIKTRFAQVHPNLKPAPIHKIRSSDSDKTMATASQDTQAIQMCPKHNRLPTHISKVMEFYVRFYHLRDPDGTAQTSGLGTPPRMSEAHSGDLCADDFRTERTKVLYGYDCSTILHNHRKRTPARRLEAAREWFDYFITTHETCVEGRQCCKSMYKRYPYPGVRAIEVDEAALEELMNDCADTEVREGERDGAATAGHKVAYGH